MRFPGPGRFAAVLAFVGSAFFLSACNDTRSAYVEGEAHAPGEPLFVANNDAPEVDAANSKVVMGRQHACALKSGKLWCWGLNRSGQVGNGESGIAETRRDPLTGGDAVPRVVTSPFLVFPDGVTDVAVGFEHTCAIRADDLYCWGSNAAGQLGIGVKPAADAVFPQPMAVLKGVQRLAARGRWTCAVANAQLFCFGSRYARSGDAYVPTLVADSPRVILPSGVRSVALSANHACAEVASVPDPASATTKIAAVPGKVSFALRCLGINTSGEIGIGKGDGLDVAKPTEVFADGVTAVAATDSRTCAVHEGVLKCFGASLGDRAVDRTAPGWKAPMISPYVSAFWTEAKPLRQISASGAVLTDSGDLLYGSFLHGKGVPQKVAVGVARFDFSEQDAAGCMMFRNHAVKCWGPNTFGQLGGGTRSLREPTILDAADVPVP